jgi:hypothetical protein
MLGGMKHTNPEIRSAIFRMDEEFMSLVQLTNLLKFVPEAEEVRDSSCYGFRVFTPLNDKHSLFPGHPTDSTLCVTSL